MQHDFTLTPNGSQTIDVAGRFFKYKSGTGKIRVRATKGGYIDLMPGQGVENEEFTSLTISDRTGLANSGVLLAGNFNFRDETISGTVDVVDGGRSRTLAGTAFAGATAVIPSAGQFAVLALFNPAGSGKNVYVERLIIASNTAGEFGIMINGAQVVNNIGSPSNPVSKKGGGAASVCIYTKASQPAGGSPGALLIDSYCVANQSLDYRAAEPIMLPPGYGLALSHAVVNASLIMTTEHFEEPI